MRIQNENLKIIFYFLFFQLKFVSLQKNTIMEYDEITDIFSELPEIVDISEGLNEEINEDTNNFNLRDAVVYSTILERKDN